MRTGKRVNRVATLCAVSVLELASSLLAYYGSNIWAQQSPVSHLLCQDSPSITSHWKPIGGLLLSHHKHHWHPRRPSTSRFALIDNSSLSDTSRAARRAPYVHAIKVARGGGRHLAEAQLFVFFFSLLSLCGSSLLHSPLQVGCTLKNHLAPGFQSPTFRLSL